jgi:hypothetical protein
MLMFINFLVKHHAFTDVLCILLTDGLLNLQDPGAEQENNTLPSVHLETSLSNQLAKG